jgi:hypothetical protein
MYIPNKTQFWFREMMEHHSLSPPSPNSPNHIIQRAQATFISRQTVTAQREREREREFF